MVSCFLDQYTKTKHHESFIIKKKFVYSYHKNNDLAIHIGFFFMKPKKLLSKTEENQLMNFLNLN